VDAEERLRLRPRPDPEAAHHETRDALIDRSDPEHPKEAGWPEADVIIGNPPFLGGKLLRRGLGDDYVELLFRTFDGRVPREADLVAYCHVLDQRQRQVAQAMDAVLRG